MQVVIDTNIIVSAWLAMPGLAGKKTTPARPRASHYKAKEIEKVLSKLNFSYLFHFALLHFPIFRGNGATLSL